MFILLNGKAVPGNPTEGIDTQGSPKSKYVEVSRPNKFEST